MLGRLVWFWRSPWFDLYCGGLFLVAAKMAVMRGDDVWVFFAGMAVFAGLAMKDLNDGA